MKVENESEASVYYKHLRRDMEARDIVDVL